MNIETAKLLVENLLDRIEQDPSSGKYKLGTISAKRSRHLKPCSSLLAMCRKRQRSCQPHLRLRFPQRLHLRLNPQRPPKRPP